MRKQREEKPRTWLDGLVGWEPEGNAVDTYWCDDPAIDPELSELEEYALDLDKSHLAVRPGQTPVRMVVSLPSAAQWGNIRPHLQELGLDSAAIIAFELCVRFPDVEAAEPEHRLGFLRLTERFMGALVRERPVMVRNVGCWLINRYSLTEDEKKTSSPESTKKSSSRRDSTPAETAREKSSARSEPSDSTGARTSDQSPGRARATESSGSGAAAPSTSGGRSTDAPGPTCAGQAPGAGSQP